MGVLLLQLAQPLLERLVCVQLVEVTARVEATCKIVHQAFHRFACRGDRCTTQQASLDDETIGMEPLELLWREWAR